MQLHLEFQLIFHLQGFLYYTSHELYLTCIQRRAYLLWHHKVACHHFKPPWQALVTHAYLQVGVEDTLYSPYSDSEAQSDSEVIQDVSIHV